MKIEIISKDEARKWAFELNLKGKFTPEQAMRESQRYVYLQVIYLLLLLKEYHRDDIWSSSTREYLEHDSYFLHPETIAFLLSYEPKLVVIADEIDSIYQKLLVVFSEKLNIKHDVFEKWAIKAKEMLAVLGIPKATESEAFYEEHDIDGILSDYFDNAWPK